MKLKLILSLAFMLGLPFSADAAVKGATVLNDSQLAGIKGGFCPLEICEDSPTGVCETIPPNTLCALTRCIYSTDREGNTIILGCFILGKYTCSSTSSYHQCILHFSTSFCSYGDSLTCGVNVEPHCTPNVATRGCDCNVRSDDTPCDWTDCVESF